MIDRKECEHLIGAVAVDLADTTPDPTLPTEWCDGWDAAVREHAEPLAEQLRMALAEIDRLRARLALESGALEQACAAWPSPIAMDEAYDRAPRRAADLDEAATTYATMRAEIEALRCGDLGPYFDGELSTERRDAFDRHLAACAKCEAGLLDLMHEAATTGGDNG